MPLALEAERVIGAARRLQVVMAHNGYVGVEEKEKVIWCCWKGSKGVRPAFASNLTVSHGKSVQPQYMHRVPRF